MRLYSPLECSGPDGYPPQWHESIKHNVREEAGYRCVRCAHPYRGGGEWSPCDERCSHRGPARLRYVATDGTDVEIDNHILAINAAVVVGYGKRVDARWRILTVHHLDGNKANCRWWNLAALCQRCHLTIQGRVDMRRVYPWPHSDWFRPYAAGYYAWVYLGEDLTRDETVQRMDELLALELAGSAA
jgi:5-methylcytosine-specific restriction endonuclease McrA